MKQFRDTQYFVTESGEVIRNGRKRKLKTTKQGYKRVTLSINGQPITLLVHRMVGECYLSNPNNLPQIDHKDFNKSNNHISNLEWVTRSENLLRAHKAGRINVRNQYSK